MKVYVISLISLIGRRRLVIHCILYFIAICSKCRSAHSERIKSEASWIKHCTEKNTSQYSKEMYVVFLYFILFTKL